MLRALAHRLDSSEGLPRRLLTLCMVLGFLALIAAGVAAAWATVRNQDYTGWVTHTYDVGLAVNSASALVERGEAARRGYLLTGRPYYRDVYRDANAQVRPTIDRIAVLTTDNPRQQRRVSVIRAILVDLDRQRSTTMALVGAGRYEEARATFALESDARVRRVRASLDTMRVEELGLLAIREAEQRAIVQMFYVILAIAGVLLALVAVTSLLTVLRYTRELTAASEGLRELNDTLEDQVIERTADLTRANEEIQRFAYIVSHDLRSPLVNVLGFTAELDGANRALGELVDRAEATAPDIVTEEARLAAREDLPEAIGFIRTSTQKMDRLINAILKLSREGRRTITPEPVDLAATVDTIAASLHQQIEGRGAEVVVERPLPALTSDRLAIEQILSNLVENAVKYLQPGRPGRIVVRGRREGPRVVVEVSDNGRGIGASDLTRVFDLFRRAGNQDQPGEGIGLAHVRALAYRLGGTIDLSSTLGEGSTFRLLLPTTAAIEPREAR